jgi:hypothetical protein
MQSNLAWQTIDATTCFARTEGVILDPVYTGGTPAGFTWNALWL